MKSILRVGEKLTLIGKNRYSHNRLRENGADVVVIQIDGVNNVAKKVCVSHIENPKAWRWIDIMDDVDWDWELR